MGKRTTTRHKEDNTFRFETFEDKLKNISVSVNLSIRDGRTEVTDDESTYFYLEIEKWIDLNRTESFGKLLEEIGNDVQTLPQVLLAKDRLAKIFLNHLKNRDNQASYEPAFALVIALARDLGPEFYPHFPEYFEAIIDIAISSKNPEVIEHAFKCYAYLSKYLRRQIAKNFKAHLKSFAPLLSPKLKNYVVIFACEAFEVVVSKFARDHPKNFLELVFSLLLKDNPENSFGVGTLLFSMMKGVSGSLKIRGPGLTLQECIKFVACLSREEDRIIWITVLKVLLQKLLNHANPADTKVLFQEVEKSVSDSNEFINEAYPLYHTLVEHEACNKIPDINSCVLFLRDLVDKLSGQGLNVFVDTIIILIETKGKSSNPELLVSLKSPIVKLLPRVDLSTIRKIDSTLQDTNHYFQSYVIPLVAAYEDVEKKKTSSSMSSIIFQCISDAVVRQNGLYHMVSKKDTFFTGFSTPFWYYEDQQEVIRPLNLSTSAASKLWTCGQVIREVDESLRSVSDLESVTRVILSLSRVSTQKCEACYGKISAIISTLIDHHTTCEDSMKPTLSRLLYFTMEALLVHSCDESTQDLLDIIPIQTYLDSIGGVIVRANNEQTPFSLWSLKCLDFLVHHMKTHKLHDNVLSYLRNNLIESLTTNLESGFKIVRSLTLSILRNFAVLNENTQPKFVELYDKFLEIENCSLLDPKFCPLVKSVLIECKVLMASENAAEDIQKLCLRYTLGLMYSNFNLIWPLCTEVVQLAGKHLNLSTFWSIFGSHFLMHFPTSDSTPRLTILKSDLHTEFLNTLETSTFGFPKSASAKLGLEESIDLIQYRMNLWKCLLNVPISKVEYSELKPIIDNTVGRCFPNQSTDRDLSNSIQKTLIPMYAFLEKCELASSDLSLWEKSLDHLISLPDVQRAVWEFLHAKRKNKLKNYKDDVDELIKSDSMDCVHKFRIDAIDTTQNKRYENESKDKRAILMGVVIRILIGKEKKWKTEKRLQVLRFIGGCTESDARQYLELTVGPVLKDDHVSPKAIEVKINKISSAIRAWRYKFPNLLDELLNLVCDLALALNSLKKHFPKHSEEDELPEDVFEDQKKAALKAARLCIVSFFTFLPKFNLEENTIERIFEVFVWNGIDEMKNHTGSNISWIMKLFLVWSSHERFHLLLAKCNLEKKLSPMEGIFELLAANSAQFEVRKCLLSILLNLITPQEQFETREPGEVGEESEKLQYSEKFDAKPVVCSGIYKFETEESIGLNVVLYGKNVILNLFQDVALFRRLVNQPGGERCLELISKLSEFVSEGEVTHKLCLILIETLPLYKQQEENLYHCLTSCKSLLIKSTDSKQLALKLAPSFTWISGRRLRSALCDILSSQSDTVLYENVRDMNAWMDLAVDTPDFTARQKAFNKFTRIFRENPFDQVMFTMASYNCFNFLLQENDIGMRNSAKSLLIVVSEVLGKPSLRDSDTKPIREFLDSVILPRLRGGVSHKDHNRFSDFLQVYTSFISNCGDIHGTFKELGKVINSEITDGLQDLQIHLRTRAMNKLAKNISEAGKTVSPTILKNYVLPLANHNLLDEEKLGKNNNELIDSSIEVLKIIMNLMSHEQYFKHLSLLVDNSKKKTKLAKQYERILIAAMDAFHFDLKFAVASGVTPQTKSHQEVEVKKEPAEETTTGELETKDDTLNAIESASEDDKEEFSNKLNQATALPEELTVLPAAPAKKCLNILKNVIIPKLRKYLNFEEKATHKLSRADKSVDEDVMLKIPCTIALVKLLKKLPKCEGENSIRSIIPSLCAGLRNELFSVRNTLRKTLLNVIKELGTNHFRTVISYLKSSLQRGYQKHVLNFTVSYLMKCLESEFKLHPEQLPIKEVLPLCDEELYSVMQEEKELAAIKAKTREASKSNAHPIIKLCAKCITSKDNLRILIDPAVKRLSEKRSPRIIKTTRQWLNSVSEGLADNIVIDQVHLIEWLKEVMHQETQQEEQQIAQPESKKRKLLVETKDAFLIPNSKKKGTADAKIAGQFLLTEFSFNSLYNGLNKSNRMKLDLIQRDNVQVLDGFVKNLCDGIQSSSKQVNVVALRCLTLLFEFDLDSFKENSIVEKLRINGFISMNNHCYRTTTDSQMTNATFKFLTGFFLRFADYKITVQDFELMLKCIQGYLTNGECSSAAITLLKGVLKNKFKSPHLKDLMEEVFNQSIISFYQHINEGCRQAYFIYLTNYCTTPKDLAVQVRLILNQFDYGMESGRLTAVEIMNSLIDAMPQACFQEIKELVFLKTLASLDRETQPPVREKLCEVMKTLFSQETKKTLVRLFLKLMQSDKHITELDTFFLIAGSVIENPNVFNGEEFQQLMEKIEIVLNPVKFEELCDKADEVTQQTQDYAIYQSLVCFKKSLVRKSGGISLWSPSSPLTNVIKDIIYHLINTHLLYEHEWVPLVTLDILHILFNNLNFNSDKIKDQVAENLELGKVCDQLVLTNLEDLKVLLKNLWTIIRTTDRDDVVMKGAIIFVQLVCVSARLSDAAIFADAIADVRRSVNHEVVKDPKNTKLRSIAFGCFRGIVKQSPIEMIKSVAEGLTRVAVRELTDEGVPQDLKLEAEKLTTGLRNALGNAEFNDLYARINDYYHQKRNQNRAKKKETLVLHPGKMRKRPKKNADTSIPFKRKKTKPSK